MADVLCNLCDKLQSIVKNWEEEEVKNESFLNNICWVGFGLVSWFVFSFKGHAVRF